MTEGFSNPLLTYARANPLHLQVTYGKCVEDKLSVALDPPWVVCMQAPAGYWGYKHPISCRISVDF